MNQKRVRVLPLIALAWNETVYYSGRMLSGKKLHYDLSLSVDHKIPIVPWTISIYIICFLFWAVIYLYMASREQREAYRFFLADGIGKLICFLFFVFMPTTLIRPEIIGTGIWNALIRYLYRFDAADNLFPSIHCMVSWFCFMGIRRQKECSVWCKCGTFLFAAAVCISTLTTRQHVLLDAAGGIGFAELSDLMAVILLRKKKIIIKAH